MRKVIAGTFVSLDGVMQAPGGPEEDSSGAFHHGGWTVPYFDDVVGEGMRQLFERPYDLLLGRKTYDIFAAYWPNAEGGPDGDLARQFNRITKYVATRSAAPLAWNNSVALHDAVADVTRLKQGDGPDLMIQGSSDLIPPLLANGLIDEFTLLVFPVLLGSGKRLFGDGTAASALKLVSAKTSPSGVMIATYKPAGEVQTGSF
jgi:dihydrofolate reductase